MLERAFQSLAYNGFIIWKLKWRTLEEKSLEILWSHFHLGVTQGVFFSHESFPVHTNTIGWEIILMILAIQVRQVTVSVAPGSMKQLDTVSVWVIIIILISSWIWFTVMIRERVAFKPVRYPCCFDPRDVSTTVS